MTGKGYPSAEMPVWTYELERLLISWAEKASGYVWLHDRSSKYFNRWSYFISVPCSIGAYMTGGTVLSDSVTQTAWLRTFVGYGAIGVGILTNLGGTLQFKEKSERHRIKSDEYGEFCRDIAAELAMDSQHRSPPIAYVQQKRQEFDRLVKQSPDIPQRIVDRFNREFGNERYSNISKPDVANGIHTIETHADIVMKQARQASEPPQPPQPVAAGATATSAASVLNGLATLFSPRGLIRRQASFRPVTGGGTPLPLPGAPLPPPPTMRHPPSSVPPHFQTPLPSAMSGMASSSELSSLSSTPPPPLDLDSTPRLDVTESSQQ